MLRDRIVLVVMAPSAPDCQAEEHLGGRREHVIELVPPVPLQVLVADSRTVATEAGCDDRFEVVRVEFVARELLGQESVVRLVGVEAVNDIVAIAPGVMAHEVHLKAVRVGVSGEVQPMAPPTLPVAWRSEQSFDQPVPMRQGVHRRRNPRRRRAQEAAP